MKCMQERLLLWSRRRWRTIDHELSRRAASATDLAGLLAAGVFESILALHGKIIRLAAHLARLDRSVPRAVRAWGTR